VYPKRWENARTGRSGYAPVCANEWKPRLCGKPRVRCGACPNQAFVAVTNEAVAAHLPDHYVSDQGLRLEAYRRLASSSTQAEVDEVVAGWEDRYGPLPAGARALARVAALRVECLRVGIDQVMGIRDEVRFSGVSLRESQRVRAERLAPGAFYQPDTGTLFIPAPRPLLSGVLRFIREMWPPDATEPMRPEGSRAAIPSR